MRTAETVTDRSPVGPREATLPAVRVVPQVDPPAVEARGDAPTRGTRATRATPPTPPTRPARSAVPAGPPELAEVSGHAAVQAETAELFSALAAEEDPAERARLQQRITTLNLPVAASIARRYRGRGEDPEDLHQVAALGLLKAVEAYDPTLGREFIVFAVPTISGEVKRHFRDKGWSIRPPRRLQELRPRLGAARSELEQDLGRSPTVSEVAAHLGVDVDEVSECLAATDQYRLHSLDQHVDDSQGSGTSVLDTLGDLDAALESTVDHLTLAPLLARLPERDRRMLTLRFEHGWTQARIAEDIGVSQMQVSRLLQDVLRRLRAAMDPAA